MNEIWKQLFSLNNVCLMSRADAVIDVCWFPSEFAKFRKGQIQIESLLCAEQKSNIPQADSINTEKCKVSERGSLMGLKFPWK